MSGGDDSAVEIAPGRFNHPRNNKRRRMPESADGRTRRWPNGAQCFKRSPLVRMRFFKRFGKPMHKPCTLWLRLMYLGGEQEENMASWSDDAMLGAGRCSLLARHESCHAAALDDCVPVEAPSWTPCGLQQAPTPAHHKPVCARHLAIPTVVCRGTPAGPVALGYTPRLVPRMMMRMATRKMLLMLTWMPRLLMLNRVVLMRVMAMGLLLSDMLAAARASVNKNRGAGIDACGGVPGWVGAVGAVNPVPEALCRPNYTMRDIHCDAAKRACWLRG